MNKIELLECRLDVLEFIAIAEVMDMQADKLVGRVRAAVPDAIVL